MITLKTDSTEITRGIINSLRDTINSKLHLIARDIKKDLEKLCDSLMKSSPEYKSISGGVLRTALAIDHPEEALKDILSEIRNNIDVTFKLISNNKSVWDSGININILKNGVQELLNLSTGKYQGKLFEVPWLEWLLTQGDRVIIANYPITYTLTPKQRRMAKSGIEIMEQGGGWRIPPQFAGTVGDNWVSRTFNTAVLKQEVDAIAQRNFGKYF
jgi:hypothetical protein